MFQARIKEIECNQNERENKMNERMYERRRKKRAIKLSWVRKKMQLHRCGLENGNIKSNLKKSPPVWVFYSMSKRNWNARFAMHSCVFFFWQWWFCVLSSLWSFQKCFSLNDERNCTWQKARKCKGCSKLVDGFGHVHVLSNSILELN